MATYSKSSFENTLPSELRAGLGSLSDHDGTGRYMLYALTGEQDKWYKFLLSYYNKIQSLRGTDYYQQALNNPYITWQDFDGLEGAELQTALNDRMNRANDILYDIQSTVTENRYNSSVSQVARDRAAGINDALSGQIAGDTAAASTGRDEAPPMAGISPETQLAREQFDYQKGITGLQTGLQILQTGASLLKGFMDFSGLLSNIRLQSTQRDAIESQTQGQNISNREALKQSFLKQFADSIPFQNGQKFQPQSVLQSFPMDAYTSEEQEYFKQLLDSGFFFGEDGTPSTALQSAYTGDLAGVASNVEGIARSGALVDGQLTDPSGAIEGYMRDYACYERLNIQATAARSNLLVAYQELQNGIAEYNKATAMYEAQSAGAQAAEDVSMSEYNQQLYNSMTGFAQNRLEQRVREAEEAMALYNKTTSEFSMFVNQKYIDQFKNAYDPDNVDSTMKIYYHNFLTGAALDGYTKFNSGRSMMPDIGPLINAAKNLVTINKPTTKQGTVGRNIRK